MKSRTTALALLIVISLVTGVLIGIGPGGCKKAQGPSQFTGFPQSFADLADRIKPAVVNISTTTTVKIPGNPFRHFFGPDEESPLDRFFGQQPDRELKKQSLGSGFIIDTGGSILTNNHVVEGAQEIRVRLAGGKEYTAKVTGRDAKTDLALIKISSPFSQLPTVPLGDSDKMRVGDWVLAVGNPFGLEQTITQGIISATGRVIGAGPYDNFLQTDAPINPGNSGGPLINLYGEVIGINTAIVSTGQGIGFAVPSNLVKKIVLQLQKQGKVERGWIGVSVQEVTPEIARALGMTRPTGALVGDLVLNGPAEKAGIRRGDVITSFGGKSVAKMSDLPMLVAETPAGTTAQVTVIREGKEVSLQARVGEMPEEKPARPARESEEGFGFSLDHLDPGAKSEAGIRSKQIPATRVRVSL